MRIAHGRAGSPSEKRSKNFTGGVWGDRVLPDDGGVTINSVLFEPGGRTHWHSHETGQVLHVLQGAGWVQVRNGAGEPIKAGDVVHIAAGEEHWHGAAPDSFVLHLAISLGDHDWLEPVSDADYSGVFAT
jgi:quercetin dioxygenase-like cupin family protein